LAEVDGLEDGVDIDADAIAAIGREHGATDVRLAASEAERQLLWKGRKTAFGAIAQIAPDYYLHDTVVPRSKLADVLEQIYEIADRHELIVMNVFHAGDGNLHPLLLFDFSTVEAGAQTVSSIIAAGMVPAALEMMDQLCVQAVEQYIHAGLPVDAAAVLLVEVAGAQHGLEHDVERIVAIAQQHGCGTVRIAQDEAERALLWKGRKTAFGAIARIKPNYYLHDTVVPRRVLPDVLRQVYEIADRYGILVMNVFHAGDGNLHPLLVYDGREPGVIERVHAAGDEIVRVSVEAGGVLSGEHGIGLEKRDLMPLMFSPVDLAAQAALRAAFDPQGLANPGKVLPSPAGCGDVQVAAAVAEGAWI
ncbi:MAG: FAD-linked oxidase C-terminal domain-containing protein, partial [Ilumatobacteraceae bacterium]